MWEEIRSMRGRLTKSFKYFPSHASGHCGDPPPPRIGEEGSEARASPHKRALRHRSRPLDEVSKPLPVFGKKEKTEKRRKRKT